MARMGSLQWALIWRSWAWSVNFPSWSWPVSKNVTQVDWSMFSREESVVSSSWMHNLQDPYMMLPNLSGPRPLTWQASNACMLHHCLWHGRLTFTDSTMGFLPGERSWIDDGHPFSEMLHIATENRWESGFVATASCCTCYYFYNYSPLWLYFVF